MDRRLDIRDSSSNLKLFKWSMLFIFWDLEKKNHFVIAFLQLRWRLHVFMDRLVWLESISASRRKKKQCFVGDLSFSCFFLMVAGAWTYKPSGSGLWFRCIALFPSYSFVTTSLPQACCCCSCAFAGGVKDCVKSSNKKLSFRELFKQSWT